MPNEQLYGPIDFDPEELKSKYEQERNRRIRPEGKAQYSGTQSGRFEKFSQDLWASNASREPLRDHTKVIIAGGGFGGLLMGARLREAGITDIRIVEVGGDFGGTWYWNRYPGAMCDIEAHIYLPLLEELGYLPKHRYAYADEMLEVSQRIGKEYGLYDKACFQTHITGARWDDDVKNWTVSTDRGDEMTSDYFILACGRQSLPKLPQLPGIDEYEGHIFHTSRWDYDYTGGSAYGGMTKLADKKVGVIGTGATALQVVPELAKDAGELLVFQRTPSTVGVRGQQKTGEDWVDTSQPGWQKERRENFQAHVQFGSQAGVRRPATNHVGDGWTDAFRVLAEDPDAVSARLGREPTPAELADLTQVNDMRLMNELRHRIDDTVKDPATAESLKPYYRWWCKRPGWHDDYLEAFNRDTVHLIDSHGHGVERFTAKGVVVEGVEYELDCIVMATGFEAGISYTHLTGFDIVGRVGPLSEHWGGRVRTFHGMSTDGFPNMFFIGGNPQTATAVNAVHLLDEQAQYVAYIVSTVEAQGGSAVEARPAEVDEWVNLIVNAPQNQAMFEFYQACTPGYYNLEGKAQSSEDLFTGGRYGEGPLAYYDLLHKWAQAGELAGFTVR